METVAQPIYSIVYEGKDITTHIEKYLLELSYEDSAEGESSSFDLTLNDRDGLWRNEWYPTKGDKIKLAISTLECGTFQIDEVLLRGLPDVVVIRCLETIVDQPLRTKKTKAHENKSLRQIAQAVARANKLELSGDASLPNIVLERITQKQQTDLKFLRKVAYDFGIIFTVRDNKLIYTSLYDIDKRAASFILEKTDVLTGYELKDKTSGVFKDAKLTYHVPGKKRVITATASASDVTTVRNADGLTYTQITTNDTLVINKRVENQQQADAIVKATLYRHNSHQQSGTIPIRGNVLAVAGNNFELRGMGQAGSGTFNIRKATHTVNPGNAWQVSMEVKRVAIASKEKQKSKKNALRPVHKPDVGTSKIVQRQNRDKVGYVQIVDFDALKK